MDKGGTIEIFFHDDTQGKEMLYDIRNCLIDAGFMVGVVRSVDGKDVSITKESGVIQKIFSDAIAVRICIPFSLVVEEGFDSFLKKSKAGNKIGSILGELVMLNTPQEKETIGRVTGVAVQFYEQCRADYVRWWQFILHALSKETVEAAIKQAFYTLLLIKESFAPIYIETIEHIVFVFDDTKKRWCITYIGRSKDISTTNIVFTQERNKSQNSLEYKKTTEYLCETSTQANEKRCSYKKLFLEIFPPKMFLGIINPFRDIKLTVKFFYHGMIEKKVGAALFVLLVICTKWSMFLTIFYCIRLIL